MTRRFRIDARIVGHARILKLSPKSDVERLADARRDEDKIDSLYNDILAYTVTVLHRVTVMEELVKDIVRLSYQGNDTILEDELNALSALIGEVRRGIGWRKECEDMYKIQSSYGSNTSGGI